MESDGRPREGRSEEASHSTSTANTFETSVGGLPSRRGFRMLCTRRRRPEIVDGGCVTCFLSWVAQSAEQPAVNRPCGGSTPSLGAMFFNARVAQLVEQSSCKRQVAGSTPVSGSAAGPSPACLRV